MSAGGPDAPLTIGIDVGTQSIRVVLVERDGTVVGSASAPLSSIRSDEVRHEQDPEAWWEAVAGAARGDGRARRREDRRARYLLDLGDDPARRR